MVNLKNNNDVAKLVRIHRLVASAFIPSPVGKKIVNHIDGNKQNNVATNLEWTDHAGNNKHAYETGLRKGPTKKFRKVAKLLNGEVLKTYKSVAEASRENAISVTSIRKACLGIAKTAKSFNWSYVD